AGDQPDAEHLRDLLRQDAVGGVVYLVQRQRLRGDGQGEDGHVRRVAFRVRRRRRQRAGEQVGSGVDRGLHVLLGGVDAAVQVELERDLGGAEAGDGGTLRQGRP